MLTTLFLPCFTSLFLYSAFREHHPNEPLHPFTVREPAPADTQLRQWDCPGTDHKNKSADPPAVFRDRGRIGSTFGTLAIVSDKCVSLGAGLLGGAEIGSEHLSASGS